MQRPIGRYDLVPESVKGRPVIGRERPASTSHQQCTSRHIPRSQALLPIPIQASTSHIRQIERCGTSTPHALRGQVQGHKLTVVIISVAAPVIGETGGQKRLLQLGGVTHAQTPAIQPGWLPALSGKQLIAHRIIDHTDVDPVRIRHRNAHGKLGKSVCIIGCAVKRVHDPTERPFWPRLTLLFALDGVGGKMPLNPLANQGFGSLISIGYWVKFILRWFLAPFGDMTLWNILASCVVIPYISPYPCVTNLMLWGHIRSVAPETSSMEGGDRFRLDTSHDRPCPLVT